MPAASHPNQGLDNTWERLQCAKIECGLGSPPLVALGLSASILFGITSAGAGPLPAVSLRGVVQIDTPAGLITNNIPDAGGAVSVAFTGPPFGETLLVGATIELGPSPSTSGSLSAGDGVCCGGAALTRSEYFAEIVGPSGVDVPVIVSALGNASFNTLEGSSFADAGLSITYMNSSGAEIQIASDEVCKGGRSSAACGNGGAAVGGGSFTVNGRNTVPSDTPIDVVMRVTVEGDAGLGGAFVDPSFSIDPSFADASEFSIEFSPGLIAPEPSALSDFAMSLVGFLGIGIAGSRRRVKKEGYSAILQG